MDGHLLSVYRVRLCAATAAAGTVTGTLIRFPYVRLIRSTVASPTQTSRHPIVREKGPMHLLEPHVLSQRLKKLCEEGQLEAAVDTLKNAPLGAQSTPVWNTLIWEVLKVHRWNLAYKLYTDVSQHVVIM